MKTLLIHWFWVFFRGRAWRRCWRGHVTYCSAVCWRETDEWSWRCVDDVRVGWGEVIARLNGEKGASTSKLLVLPLKCSVVFKTYSRNGKKTDNRMTSLRNHAGGLEFISCRNIILWFLLFFSYIWVLIFEREKRRIILSLSSTCVHASSKHVQAVWINMK